ncbi:MAG: hypothetical protein ACSHWY_15610 [Octadecabacter sp.]
MSKKIITYDLYKAGQNYDGLISAIKTYSSWAKINQSVWAISTDQSCTAIRDHLNAHLDSNDRLFVGEMTGVSAWYGLPEEVSNWLKEIA